MRFQILAAITLFLQLQSSSAAPSKRCMTQAQITSFQASWPKSGGHGPVLNPCNEGSNGNLNTTGKGTPDIYSLVGSDRTTTALKLRAAEIETLAKRYLADERSTQSDGMERRCMTADQISAFQAAWPKTAGLGPALVSCPT